MVKNDKTPLFHHKFVYLKRFKVNYLVMSWTTWSGFQVAQFATWKFGRALSTVGIKPDGHIWGLEFNQYVCFSFLGNRAIFGWDMSN